MKDHIIPFFVAGRPASFRILKGVFLKYPRTKVGIMTHAFTSKNVWQIFKNFPYDLPLPYEDGKLTCNEDRLAQSLVRMTDSGIFTKNGCLIDYEELFSRYNQMGAEFGIMIDVFRDAKATLESAERALKVYERNRKRYNFRLVAVAQGENLEEYLECYKQLSSHFEFIAIGGLLKKRENSARYVTVRNEGLLYEVLHSIVKEFGPNWLFVLGCYHPSRHKQFESIGVWGSDYKGWTFQYRKKRQIIRDVGRDLLYIESENDLTEVLKEQLDRVDKIESDLLNKEKEWRETKEYPYKKILWTKVKKLRADLEAANEKLLKKRELLAKYDHLPFDYKHNLALLDKIVEEKEQSLRFRQVREYIEANVYRQLQ
jgi:hypothetical protein